ncbi:MAG: MTH938/NDUFAF3 family protein [Candidatus Cloacimonadales bacterium]
MQIDKYSFGKMVIDSVEYKADLIIFPERVKTDWWRAKGHLLQPADLSELPLDDLQTIIVGQGEPGLLKIADSTKKMLQKKEIALISAPTQQAVEIYNSSPDKSRLLALFHLSC